MNAAPLYGRQPGAILLRRDSHVGEASAEAQAVLQDALSQGYRGMPAESLIAGSVSEVAEQFRSFGELGYTDILVRYLTNNQPKVLGSLERLAAAPGTLARVSDRTRIRPHRLVLVTLAKARHRPNAGQLSAHDPTWP